MKFVSKQAILRVILRPGIPGNKLSGTAPIPALSVRFEDGEATVENEEIIKLLMESEAFKNKEIICADEAIGEMRARTTEPQHMISEIQHGTPIGQTNPKAAMTPDQMKEMIAKMAMDQAKEIATQTAPLMAKEMLKEMLKDPELLKGLMQDSKAETEEKKVQPNKKK